jgi:ATP synthase protein I
VTPSDQSLETEPQNSELAQAESYPSGDSGNSMQEYYQLQKTLFLVTLAMTGVAFFSVWISYSLDIALNYLLGACVGVVYLRRLAKDIEGLGTQKRSLGISRLALFIGLIVVATQLQNLQILPIFFGFMTYKAAIIAYVVQTTFQPQKK